MSKHPYPEHVLDAVEEALRDKLYEGALPVQLAETALQALWDASRVDTVAQAEQLPDDMRLITPKGAYMAPWSLDKDDLPAHVIDWGDSDA